MPGFASTKISNKTKRRRLIVQQSQSDAFFAIIALFRVTSLPLLTFVTFFWPKNAEKNFFNLTSRNKKFISVRKAALFQISTWISIDPSRTLRKPFLKKYPALATLTLDVLSDMTSSWPSATRYCYFYPNAERIKYAAKRIFYGKSEILNLRETPSLTTHYWGLNEKKKDTNKQRDFSLWPLACEACAVP